MLAFLDQFGPLAPDEPTAYPGGGGGGGSSGTIGDWGWVTPIDGQPGPAPAPPGGSEPAQPVGPTPPNDDRTGPIGQPTQPISGVPIPTPQPEFPQDTPGVGPEPEPEPSPGAGTGPGEGGDPVLPPIIVTPPDDPAPPAPVQPAPSPPGDPSIGPPSLPAPGAPSVPTPPEVGGERIAVYNEETGEEIGSFESTEDGFLVRDTNGVVVGTISLSVDGPYANVGGDTMTDGVSPAQQSVAVVASAMLATPASFSGGSVVIAGVSVGPVGIAVLVTISVVGIGWSFWTNSKGEISDVTVISESNPGDSTPNVDGDGNSAEDPSGSSPPDGYPTAPNPDPTQPSLPQPDLPADWDGKTPPFPDWVWKGPSDPGGPYGAWEPPDKSQSLHGDFGHNPPVGPHVDWNIKREHGTPTERWRIFPDGRVERKN